VDVDCRAEGGVVEKGGREESNIRSSWVVDDDPFLESGTQKGLGSHNFSQCQILVSVTEMLSV
jgi:hypothetical protein